VTSRHSSLPCSVRRIHLISLHLISTVTPFHLYWAAVSVLRSDPVRPGCDQSERSRSRRLVWLVAAAANWVASQRTRRFSVEIKFGQHSVEIKSNELRWNDSTLLWWHQQKFRQVFFSSDSDCSPRTDRSIVFAMWRPYVPHLVVPLAHASLPSPNGVSIGLAVFTRLIPHTDRGWGRGPPLAPKWNVW